MKKLRKLYEYQSQSNSKIICANLSESGNYIIASDEGKCTYIWRQNYPEPINVI